MERFCQEKFYSTGFGWNPIKKIEYKIFLYRFLEVDILNAPINKIKA
jgi:hypothetical protein